MEIDMGRDAHAKGGQSIYIQQEIPKTVTQRCPGLY